MLQPARTKYRKMQKGRSPGLAHRGNKLAFGEFGLFHAECLQSALDRVARGRHYVRMELISDGLNHGSRRCLGS